MQEAIILPEEGVAPSNHGSSLGWERVELKVKAAKSMVETLKSPGRVALVLTDSGKWVTA